MKTLLLPLLAVSFGANAQFLNGSSYITTNVKIQKTFTPPSMGEGSQSYYGCYRDGTPIKGMVECVERFARLFQKGETDGDQCFVGVYLPKDHKTPAFKKGKKYKNLFTSIEYMPVYLNGKEVQGAFYTLKNFRDREDEIDDTKLRFTIGCMAAGFNTFGATGQVSSLGRSAQLRLTRRLRSAANKHLKGFVRLR